MLRRLQTSLFLLALWSYCWIEALALVSDDEEASVVPYKISRFGIKLYPTSHRITDETVASFLSPVIEATLFESLGGAYTQSSYVLLAQAFVSDDDSYRRHLSDTNSTATTTTTTIIVKGGLITFKTQPPAEQVPEVIERGINENLVRNLPDTDVFQGITSATFLALEEQVVEKFNGELQDQAPTQGDATPADAETSTILGTGILQIVLGTLGVIFIFAGLLVLTRKQYYRKGESSSSSAPPLEGKSKTLGDDASADDDNKASQTSHFRTLSGDDDNKSINSEWTTATTETQNHQFLAKSQYLAAGETFERNSLLAIKKDMLQCEWTTSKLPNIGETQFEQATEKDTPASIV